MTAILSEQYENQNAGRRYPFDDTATMADRDGNVLPTDFLIDCQLYTIDLTDRLYISSIDQGAGLITFSTVGDTMVRARAAYTQAGGTAEVMEIGGLERQIGILVFGAGLASLALGRSVRVFDPDATIFCAAAEQHISQVGVRGVVLPDGTVLTGSVTLTGQEGLQVTSQVRDGLSVLRFDALGVAPALEGDQPICTIEAIREVDSPFVISAYDTNTLAISCWKFGIDDICAAQKDQQLPSQDGVLPAAGDGVCAPAPTPPTPPDDPGAQDLTFEVCPTGQSSFSICTVPYAGRRSPISIRAAPGQLAQSRMEIPPVVQNTGALDRLLRAFRLPALAQNAIMIGFRGLP